MKFTWPPQPSTVIGLAWFVSVASGFVAYRFTGDPGILGGIVTLVGSAVAILVPDNTSIQRPIEKLVFDAATAVMQQKLAASSDTLVADVIAALTAYKTPVMFRPGTQEPTP